MTLVYDNGSPVFDEYGHALPNRGVCSGCGELRMIRADGMITGHRCTWLPKKPYCDGSYRRPRAPSCDVADLGDNPG